MRVIALLIFGILVVKSAQSQSNYGMYPLITISQINETPRDTIKLKVYVIDVYFCPPCPPGAQCKPCMDPNITVVDEKPKDIGAIPSEKRLMILTRKEEQFKTGKRYFMTIRFKHNKENNTDQAVLISFKPA